MSSVGFLIFPRNKNIASGVLWNGVHRLSKYQMVSWYTRQCKLNLTHNTSTAFHVPSFTQSASECEKYG